MESPRPPGLIRLLCTIRIALFVDMLQLALLLP
ncbi:MAG: hypothetical protein JWN51_1503, partial [Phycisphaerales bacterium]|nr:hypothetical protein [Phycisphaerales bacterium]